MKPETRAALNKIGWDHVVAQYPATAIKMMNALRREPNYSEAKENLAVISSVDGAIKRLSNALSDIPYELQHQIDLWSADENELEDEVPTSCHFAIEASEKLLRGLSMAAEINQAVVDQSGAGSLSLKTGEVRGPKARPGDDWGYRLAITLGEVYFLAQRQSPGAGKDGDQARPNGPFQKALISILNSEKHPVPSTSTINNMTTAAKRQITMAWARRTLAKNNETRKRWSGKPQVSLFNHELHFSGKSLMEYASWHLIISDD